MIRRDIAEGEGDVEWTAKCSDGFELCMDFLQSKNCVQCFVHRMIDKNLHDDLYYMNDMFPEDLQRFLKQCEFEDQKQR